MFRMKRWAALALCLTLCLSTAAYTYAAETPVVRNGQGEIVPYAMYIRDKGCTLELGGKTAAVNSWVMGQVGVATKCMVHLELQEKAGSRWETVDVWIDIQNDTMAEASGSYTVTSGRTYRAVATVTVWAGDKSETMTLTTAEKRA